MNFKHIFDKENLKKKFNKKSLKKISFNSKMFAFENSMIF